MEKGKRLGGRTSFAEILLSPEVSILIPLIILVTYTSINNPNFLKIKNILVILRYTAFIGTLAIGEAFALMCGEIDMSAGACSTFTGIMFGVALVWWELPIPAAVIVALAFGALVGAINAFFIVVTKLSSWIVTMSMQYICYGAAMVIAKGHVIKYNTCAAGEAIQAWATARPAGINWAFFIFLGLILLGEILIRFTPIGRKIHSVGLSPYAARVAGINVSLVKSLCMMACGFMGAVTGILQSVNTQTSNNVLGVGNEFPAVIAAVIGGVSNMGGKGSMLGCLLGVIMYQTLKNCLQTLGANNNLQLVLLGLILILAVYVDVLKTKLSHGSKKAVAK